jgi:hypothetical protein
MAIKTATVTVKPKPQPQASETTQQPARTIDYKVLYETARQSLLNIEHGYCAHCDKAEQARNTLNTLEKIYLYSL